MSYPPYHTALIDPSTYAPLPCTTVTYVETHISRLYLGDALVLKIKKPVNFGFLDFSTLESRRHFCTEEVRLNRRFAPGIYRDVVAIRRDGERYVLDAADGPAEEYGVLMQRLPDELLLDRLLARNTPLPPDRLTKLGRIVAHHHTQSAICRDEVAAYADTVARNWEENFTQITPLVGITIAPPALTLCRARIDRLMARLHDRMVERERQGWVRDCHGDLHAEHICLSRPIVIYDCIEFNRRFRVTDVLDDLAFLLMDLDYRGRRDLAALVRQGWEAELAASDEELLQLYKIYRAFVRGKVDTFLATDKEAEGATRQAARNAAVAYFNLVLGYLAPTVQILTCGLMGCGKSSAAQGLARALGASLLRSDVIRKELAGLPAATRRDDAYGTGLYSVSVTALTYDTLHQRAMRELAAGHSVIVDAAFGDPHQRRSFVAGAAAHGIPTLILHLHCTDDELIRRLQHRSQSGDDPSDGRPELLDQQRREFIAPAADEPVLILDAGTLPTGALVQHTLCRILQSHGECK